jgi:hypothetical protein
LLSRSLKLLRHSLNSLFELLVCGRKDNEDVAFGKLICQVLVLIFVGKEASWHKRQVIKLSVSYSSWWFCKTILSHDFKGMRVFYQSKSTFCWIFNDSKELKVFRYLSVILASLCLS